MVYEVLNSIMGEIQAYGGTGKTVLVLDDSKSVRTLISYALSYAGFFVISAESSLDAARLIRDRRIDLIITDLHMPLMGGIEFVKRIRAGAGESLVPIIMLTREDQLKKKQEAFEAGVNRWITKPFKVTDLVDTVEYMLGGGNFCRLTAGKTSSDRRITTGGSGI